MRLEVAPGASADISPDATFGAGTRIHVRSGALTIAAGAVLGDGCVIVVHERVDIGPGARLGDGVVLIDVAHGHDDPDRPVRHQPLLTAPIGVGANAVIGHGAVLERGASVAAGARVAEHVVVRATTNQPAARGPRMES
jgi:acetyltransferase-like isoleucine patch superfamily enzyme